MWSQVMGLWDAGLHANAISLDLKKVMSVALCFKFHGLFAAQSQQERNAECQWWLKVFEAFPLINFWVPKANNSSVKPFWAPSPS